jgi:hypothetical protein
MTSLSTKRHHLQSSLSPLIGVLSDLTTPESTKTVKASHPQSAYYPTSPPQSTKTVKASHPQSAYYPTSPPQNRRKQLIKLLTLNRRIIRLQHLRIDRDLQPSHGIMDKRGDNRAIKLLVRNLISGDDVVEEFLPAPRFSRGLVPGFTLKRKLNFFVLLVLSEVL